MWKRISLMVLAVGCLTILFEAENTDALKCYFCNNANENDPCPNDGRGVLQTCVGKRETTCWKNVNKKPHPNKAIGATFRKGCAPKGGWGPRPFNESAHPGCQYFNDVLDYCSCETDRCNDEGEMTEYLTKS